MGVHFLSRYRNPLAYPAGYAPGFDPNHVAAGTSLRLSAILQNGNARSLLSGRLYTPENAPTTKYLSVIGPAVAFVGASSQDILLSVPVVTDVDVTLAAIVSFDSFAARSSVVGTGTHTNSTQMRITTGGRIDFLQDNIVAVAGPTLSLGVPYFIAISGTSRKATSNINFFVLNLLTGQKTTVVASQSITIAATLGTAYIAKDGGNVYANATIAAVMWSNAYLEIPALTNWAADPWSFWYPNPGDNWIAAQAAAGLSRFSWSIEG